MNLFEWLVSFLKYLKKLDPISWLTPYSLDQELARFSTFNWPAWYRYTLGRSNRKRHKHWKMNDILCRGWKNETTTQSVKHSIKCYTQYTLGCTKISKSFQYSILTWYVLYLYKIRPKMQQTNDFGGIFLAWPPFCRKCPFYTLKTNSKCSKFRICLLRVQKW